MHHILSANQFEVAELEQIMDLADEMYEMSRFHEGRRELADRHRGETVVTIFYEESTRTRLSFEAAAVALGAGYISTAAAKKFSSVVKGETGKDTAKTIARLGTVGVIRHDEEGALVEAAEAAGDRMAIISGGDGAGEHPTQALLDLHTIRREKGRTEGLGVVIGGDLKKGRTARSLALLLSKYSDNDITFVSLPELRIGDDIKEHLTESGTTFRETEDLHGALGTADVVYWTRLQLERHNVVKGVFRRLLETVGIRRAEHDAISLDRNYILDREALDVLSPNATIMHPLPRNNEIPAYVDDDERAKYFDQVENGKFIRMALLDMILSSQIERERAEREAQLVGAA